MGIKFSRENKTDKNRRVSNKNSVEKMVNLSSCTGVELLRDRVKGALFGLLIADALAAVSFSNFLEHSRLNFRKLTKKFV